jgi:hypothetical protein
MLFDPICNERLICPVNAFLQSRHVNLYIPVISYLSMTGTV